MIGITEMPGIDDFGPAETFTTADAATVENWAVAKGIATLSFWALQRDNGGCVGTGGLRQLLRHRAEHVVLQPHLRAVHQRRQHRRRPTTSRSSLSPAAGSVAPGGSATATVSTAVTSGSAQSVALSTSGAPAGVTVTLSPTSVTAGGSATLTVDDHRRRPPPAATRSPSPVSAASGSHSATYTLTVTGGGGGGTGSLVNGGLETGSLSPWTCQSGGAVVTTPVHSGSHALHGRADRLARPASATRPLTLGANTSYTLTGWVQGNYAYVGVSGGATASTWTSGAGWTKLTVPFTTGASGTVTVYLHGWYAQGNVYGDDFAVS